MAEKIIPFMAYSKPDTVTLSEVMLGEDDSPKWQHVAIEGQYLGYNPPFAITRKTFNEMVANFQKHPKYKAGEDGIGMADVVPWDFEHASEQWSSEGTIPTSGAPAQGWISELKVEAGQDGKAQLWALTTWLPMAKDYIKNKQYKWSSISVVLNMSDPETNESLGAVLTSVALTNHPFIQGLESLAASTKNGAKELRIGRWYEAAGTALEAIGCIKDLLGLPELSSIQEVMSQIDKLRQWTQSGTTPIGIDTAGIFGSLRQILNIGALTTESEVLDALGKIAQRAIEEQAVSDGAAINESGNLPDTNAANMAGAKDGGVKMIPTLASKLGVKEVEKEITEAVDDAIELRSNASKTLSTSGKTKDILESIATLKTHRDEHKALLKALGTDKTDDAVACVADLQKAAKELEEMKPKYAELDTKIEAINLAKAEADVDMVISANGFDPNLKDALMLQRQADAKAFADKFPVDPAKISLTKSVTNPVGSEPAKKTAETPASGELIDLSSYPGANMSFKARAYLASKNAGWNSMDYDTQAQMVHGLLNKVAK